MIVGIYVKPGKWAKMNMSHFVETAKKQGITVIRIDLNINLEEQGPFDLIVHKSIDLFVQSNYFHNKDASIKLQIFKNYISTHPDIPISNPLSFDEFVTSRRRMFNELIKIQFKNDCIVPDLSIVTEKCIIKPDLACGSKIAHEFAIVDRNDAIIQNENNKNMFIQPYFDAGNAVLKVYSIGKYTKVHLKKPETFELDFDMDSIERIANVLRNVFNCDLFGFDLIQEIKSRKWYIVDLNSFSGFEVIPGFEDLLIDFFHQKTGK